MNLAEPEVINLEEIELELACESRHHYDEPAFNNHHAEGGQLWYVNFTEACHCDPPGISVRCDSWARFFLDKAYRKFQCTCGGYWRVVVLEPINEKRS